MFVIYLADRKKNICTREKINITDVVDKIASLKWSFVGHVVRADKDILTKDLMQWWPRTNRRNKRQPPNIQTHDIQKVEDWYG